MMGVTDEKSALEALTLADRLRSLAAERETFWEMAAKREDLLGESLRGLGGIQYLVTGQVSNVERGGVVGAMKAMAWYSQHAPDKLARVKEQLSSLSSGPISDAVKAWLWVQENKPENLLTNPGFEEADRNTAKAEMDWKTEGAPKGWSIWSTASPSPTATARFELLGGKGRAGSVAASIVNGISACYLQPCKVQTGEKYLCVCWVKADPPDKRCAAWLAIRFREPSGAWHSRTDLEPIVNAAEGQGDWQPVSVLVTVPEGAGILMVMPGVGRQEEGARALFDDVALYRIP